MLNKVMIIGRLGADPDVTYTQGGQPVARLRIATDESYTDRDGNRQERTEWHRVTFFRRTAEVCQQYLHKGSLVYVEGKLQTRKWTDQNGQDRYSTEISGDRMQMLDSRSSSSGYADRVPRQGAAPYDEGMEPAFPSDDGFAQKPQSRRPAPQQPPRDAAPFPGDMDEVPF